MITLTIIVPVAKGNAVRPSMYRSRLYAGLCQQNQRRDVAKVRDRDTNPSMK